MSDAVARGDPGLDTIETDIPARLDRLPWSKWLAHPHRARHRVDLDGPEVTIVGSIAGAISAKGSGLNISSGDAAGLAATYYLVGASLDRPRRDYARQRAPRT